MALLLRWWRTLLHALSLHRDDAANWVEPGNDITRAILSGEPLWLPAITFEAPAPAISETIVVEPETIEVAAAAAEVAAPAAPEEAAAPAAEERREAPATRTRRRRFGRRAA